MLLHDDNLVLVKDGLGGSRRHLGDDEAATRATRRRRVNNDALAGTHLVRLGDARRPALVALAALASGAEAQTHGAARRSRGAAARCARGFDGGAKVDDEVDEVQQEEKARDGPEDDAGNDAGRGGAVEGRVVRRDDKVGRCCLARRDERSCGRCRCRAAAIYCWRKM